jgi:hypothetical protein
MAAVAHVERGPSTVAASSKCDVALVPVQVKESGSAAGIIGVLLLFLAIIGGLLIFLGIIGPIGTLVGGTASFVGGILLTSVGGRQFASAAFAGVR